MLTNITILISKDHNIDIAKTAAQIHNYSVYSSFLNAIHKRIDTFALVFAINA